MTGYSSSSRRSADHRHGASKKRAKLRKKGYDGRGSDNRAQNSNGKPDIVWLFLCPHAAPGAARPVRLPAAVASVQALGTHPQPTARAKSPQNDPDPDLAYVCGTENKPSGRPIRKLPRRFAQNR